MPEKHLPAPESRDLWLTGEPARLEQAGKSACVQCWVYLTFLRLERSGFPVTLCHEMPDEGIVVALTGNLGDGYSAPDHVFLTGIVADGMPHPACHFAAHTQRLPRSAYLPLWPQPGLIPRSSPRGTLFENIFFYGDPPNLAPQLRASSFRELIRSRLGMNFQIREASAWNDYSDADCVLAVRQLGRRRFLRKPSTKLYNSWMAGVPMIGGADSSFGADGIPGVDYLRCKSMEEILAALGRLRDDLAFREGLVRKGAEAARQFTAMAILERWKTLLRHLSENEAPRHFSKTPAVRRMLSLQQRLSIAGDALRGGF
jgi:hypothetical protein